MDLNSIPGRLLETLERRHLPPPPASSGSSTPALRSPRLAVQIVAPDRSRQADELRLLLLRRLRGTTLVMTLAMLAALVTTLSLPILEFRIAALIAATFCFFLIRRSDSFSLSQLRWLELSMLTILVLQCTLMPMALMAERAWASDPITVAMDEYFALGAWATAIVVYGLLIPNTWKRAALVIGPFACIPNLGFFLLGHFDSSVGIAFASLHHGPPFPIVLVGAIGGIYGAHTLHTIRRDEFKAKQFGRYVLKEKLGAGGMGEVFRAEHDLLKRPCALKLINSSKNPSKNRDASAIARFEREVQATAKLTHASTVEVYDFGQTDEGDFYYVMELLSGMSLHDLVMKTGPLPPGRVVHLLRQICGALKEAHAMGLIHRDIKPANIFAAHQGGIDDVAKLLDFGLVRFAETSPDLNLTQFGTACGSPPYMSPEQAEASEALDARGDLYALGSVGYFLITAIPPFTGKTIIDVLVALTRDPVVPPSNYLNVPPDLEAVILKCLQKKPEDRYADAQALNDALSACKCAGEWDSQAATRWWTHYRDWQSRELPDDRASSTSQSAWIVPLSEEQRGGQRGNQSGDQALPEESAVWPPPAPRST